MNANKQAPSLSKEEAKKRIEALKKELWKANYAYFNENRELIPESVRDQLKKELIALEEAFPELITPDSPTQRVGAPLSGKLPKLPHKTPKYSLADAFSAEELRAFDARVKRLLGGEKVQYSCEPKIDGLNITLWYEKGLLVKALTRGDGKTGEDVTHTIKTCENLPLSLPYPLTFEVSGEVFIAKKDFEHLKNKYPEYANARNLASGSVRQLDPAVAAERKLRIFLYELGEIAKESFKAASIAIPQNQAALFALFDTLNLPHAPLLKVCEDIEEVIAFCESFDEKKRQSLFFDIDGIVIKVFDFAQRARLGYTAKVARFAIAYKFPATKKYTRLKEVHFQVGRTGAITPVAILDPVEIDGSVVSRATLHTAEEIEKKDIRIGDTVIVYKAGDIIPEVLGPIKELRTGAERPIHFPTHCPECQHPLDRSESIYRCMNPHCPAKHREGLFYFAQMLKIEGLGKKTIEGLLELELIHTPADFWRLRAEDLSMLPGFKEKKIQNLLQSLQSKKRFYPEDFFSGLGIRYIGRETALLIVKALEKRFGTFSLKDFVEKILPKLLLEDLLAIKGVGEKSAQAFYKYIQSPMAQKLLKDFIAVGIDFEWRSEQKTPFTGKRFLITGSFSHFKRSTLQEIIKMLGGEVVNSFSHKVDVLLVGDSPGSKYEKAKKEGIPMWNEARFRAYLSPYQKMLSEKIPSLKEVFFNTSPASPPQTSSTPAQKTLFSLDTHD